MESWVAARTLPALSTPVRPLAKPAAGGAPSATGAPPSTSPLPPSWPMTPPVDRDQLAPRNSSSTARPSSCSSEKKETQLGSTELGFSRNRAYSSEM